MVRFTCNSSLTFFRIEDQVARVLSVSKDLRLRDISERSLSNGR